MKNNIFVLIICFCFLVNIVLAYEENTSGERISLINLIANPEKYHNKLVLVSGHAKIEFENYVLCFSEKPLSSKDCIWINMGEDIFDHGTNDQTMKKLEEIVEYWKGFDKKNITIRGFFDMENDGHLGSSSGGIKK